MSTAAPASMVATTHLATRPRDDGRAWAAHLLRRTSLTIDTDRIDRVADLDRDAAVAEVLAHHGPVGADLGRAPITEEWTGPILWWIEQMGRSDSGLTDRLAWFWHGLLTTSANKVSHTSLIASQLDHLRSQARGDFRTLLHGFVTSGALLQYLDASWSTAARPNENLARELMELFTVGRGHYDEDDVRAAARALAGWVVDDGEVEFWPENAFIAPLLFRGEQANWDTTSVVDQLCDDPATAVRVAGLLWTDLVGTPPAPDVAVDLGTWWQGRDLAIEPLLERILGDEAFQGGRLARPRSGLEWFCAARAALGRVGQPSDGALWSLEQLGQLPYTPPNVAGWPGGDRWLSPASLLARASVVHDLDVDSLPATESVDDILDACGLHEVSPATIDALTGIDRPDDENGGDPEILPLVRWRLALTSPEFNLA